MPEILVEGNINKEFCEKAIHFFCDALGIEPPNLHVFTDETIVPNGACYQNADDEYMIVLNEHGNEPMMTTLAHELTHVKQYLLDDLAGCFDTSIPYMNRWWEKEAYIKEVEMTKLIIEATEKGEI